jgi:hypothetical protein
MSLSPRALLPGALALAAVAAIGLTGTANASSHHKHHHKKHHSAIPQHNGGDHDADNRGGPSDGDGNT